MSLIYELAWHEGTSPIAALVQTRIQKISEKHNILRETLWDSSQSSQLRTAKVKRCAGSVPKKWFLQLGWEFKLERSEVDVTTMSQEIEQFKAQITNNSGKPKKYL